MLDNEKIRRIFATQDPATFTDDTFTPEEWAMMQEQYNELATKTANLKSINEWVRLTNALPNGILTPEEKVEIMQLVLSRVPKDLR